MYNPLTPLYYFMNIQSMRRREREGLSQASDEASQNYHYLSKHLFAFNVLMLASIFFIAITALLYMCSDTCVFKIPILMQTKNNKK